MECPRHEDEGHWVSGQKQCIVSVSLATNSMDVDLIKKVRVYVSLVKNTDRCINVIYAPFPEGI